MEEPNIQRSKLRVPDELRGYIGYQKAFTGRRGGDMQTMEDATMTAL
jgi:hypothetical protein